LFPHRAALTLLISICHIALKNTDRAFYWMRKPSKDVIKTEIDREVGKLMEKWRARKYLFLIQFEYLYFFKVMESFIILQIILL
jgi:hypothetical protein